MAKNKQSNLIASVKMLNMGFINKHIITLGKEVRGYLALVNYQSLVSKIFPSAPPHLFFSIKYTQNRLLSVSFLELYDFMIYQHVNKRAKILPLATFHIVHLCKQFNQTVANITNFYATFQNHYFLSK